MDKFTLFFKNPQYSMGGEDKPTYTVAQKPSYIKTLVDISKTINKNINYLSFDKAGITLTLNDLKLINFTVNQSLQCNHAYIKRQGLVYYYWITNYNFTNENSLELEFELDYWLTYWPLTLLEDALVFVERCHIDQFAPGEGTTLRYNTTGEFDLIDGVASISNRPLYTEETIKAGALWPHPYSDAEQSNFSFVIKEKTPVSLYRCYQLTFDSLENTAGGTEYGYIPSVNFQSIPQFTVMYPMYDDVLQLYASQGQSNDGEVWFDSPFLTQSYYALVDETQIKPFYTNQPSPPLTAFSKNVLPVAKVFDANAGPEMQEQYAGMTGTFQRLTYGYFFSALNIPESALLQATDINSVLPDVFTEKNTWDPKKKTYPNPYSTASSFVLSDVWNMFNSINGIELEISNPGIDDLFANFKPAIDILNAGFIDLKFYLQYCKLQLSIGNTTIANIPFNYFKNINKVSFKLKQFVTPTENYWVLDFSKNINDTTIHLDDHMIMTSADRRYNPAFKNPLSNTTSSAPVRKFWNEHQSVYKTSLKQADLSINQAKLNVVSSVFKGIGSVVGGGVAGSKGGPGGAIAGGTLGGIFGGISIAGSLMQEKQAELSKQQLYNTVTDLSREPDSVNTQLSDNSFFSMQYILANELLLDKTSNFSYEKSVIDVSKLIKCTLWTPNQSESIGIFNLLKKNGYALNQHVNVSRFSDGSQRNSIYKPSRYYYNYWKISLFEETVDKSIYNNYIINYFNQEFSKGVRLWNVANPKVIMNEYKYYNIENDILPVEKSKT